MQAHINRTRINASLSGQRKARVLVRGTQQTAVATAADTEARPAVKVAIKEHAGYTVKGTVRKINEDRYSVQVAGGSGSAGDAVAFAGVYDGHGGYAVADWLEKRLMNVVSKNWRSSNPSQSMTDAFLAADRKLLEAKAGFMGLGERGVGGSKCGATAALALLYQDPKNPESTNLVTANIGDARIVLVRDGKPIQLTEDHVPDNEEERKRIEKFNPNPRLPLVRYVGGTWRVGGLLALSRAFGDAYLKGSLQFEGLQEGSDGYSSGFGVIAEPYTTVTTLDGGDAWLIVASDGLFAEVERGGGGGLDNNSLVDLLQAAGNTPCSKIAETLANTAVEMGSTDDVTVVVMRLGQA